jgi:hypothetical protein
VAGDLAFCGSPMPAPGSRRSGPEADAAGDPGVGFFEGEQLVSGGHVNSGCASGRNRSNVDPDRPLHNANTGSANMNREAGTSTDDVIAERCMLSGQQCLSTFGAG